MNEVEKTTNRLGYSTTNEWLTPPELVKKFGEFNLDPCASHYQKWKLAQKEYFIEDNGLQQDWEGRVWMNPPYDRTIKDWVRKFYEHGHGVALLPSRTGTSWFHDYVFSKGAVIFLKGRIKFIGYKDYKQFAGMFDSILWIMNQELWEQDCTGKVITSYPANIVTTSSSYLMKEEK